MQTLNFRASTSIGLPTNYLALAIFGAILLFLCSSSQVLAQGNLMIMPKRVVFEGSKKSHELNLANTGQDTAHYAITLVHYKMKEDGSFEEMNPNDSSEYFADKFVRFFPRSISLGPNESQTVRIQLTHTNKLLPGEYRSHIYFRSVPDEKPLGEKELQKFDSTAISVRLVPIFGISIPVIIRVGESTTQINLTNSSFEMFDNSSPLLKITLNRAGNMSVYGDITIDHISPEGKVTKAGIIQGLGVYTPNLLRHIKIGLSNEKGIDYSKGKLHVVYQPQENINQTNIAQTEVYLGTTSFKKPSIDIVR